MRIQRVDSSSYPVPVVVPGQSLSDEEVVRRVLNGDAASYEVIVRRYNQRLFRTLRATITDDHDAEALVQETYVKAYDRLAEFQGTARFSTWLMRIAIHEVRDRGQLTKGNGHRNGNGNGNGNGHGNGNGLLEQAIDHLPATLRTVFVLRDVDGLATDETADCLGITTVNVRVRLHRARTQLRSHVQDHAGADMRQLHPFPEDRCDRVVAGVMGRIRQRAQA